MHYLHYQCCRSLPSAHLQHLPDYRAVFVLLPFPFDFSFVRLFVFCASAFEKVLCGYSDDLDKKYQNFFVPLFLLLEE